MQLIHAWYAVELSSAVSEGSVQKLNFHGEVFAIWRSLEGKVSVVPDRCPHKGASLSAGNVGDQGLESRIGAVENARVGVNQEQSIDTIDVSTREGANLAIKVVGRALEQLSMERSRLGGLENRLEFTIERARW